MPSDYLSAVSIEHVFYVLCIQGAAEIAHIIECLLGLVCYPVFYVYCCTTFTVCK